MEQKDWKTYFDAPAFQAQFDTGQPLGSCPDGAGTTFRLWAPTAEGVQLRLFSDGEGGQPWGEYPLERGEQGVWQYTLPGCGSGSYYDYLVTVEGVTRRTADPYARACGRNGGRSMVIDLAETNPPGWAEDRPPAPAPESIIWEIHVRDFSDDPASGVPASLRGKYLALALTGTTLNGDGSHPTGLDYLKKLGVTHVQLMPVYDFGSVDEGGPADRYNWGYDPVNYNVPEGSYATDPTRGAVRIRELKTAIQALHRQGFRVIMDVVYNHTYHLDSWLWRTVPWYYTRQNPDGSPSNGSGCGCDLASERSMCGRYILESVLYWAEEYHMDGFRFDLMGLLDVPLMNRIQAELDRRWGRGEKLVYGEPWSAGPTGCRPGTVLAHKGNLTRLDPAIGAFCDATRDVARGSLSVETGPGMASGGGLNGETLACCLTGWAGEHPSFSVQAPSQTITYLSAHDDWTLWDKLVMTLDEERCFEGGAPAVFRASRLAAAFNFCCQGRPFLLAGEEFGRTKLGVKNTYNASPELNRLDWSLAWENELLVEYYRGLIALRLRCPGLCDKAPQAAERLLRTWEPGPNCAAALVDNRGGSDGDTLCLIFNAAWEPVTLTLPAGRWNALADGSDSTRWQHPEPVPGTVTMPPMSALILGGREEAAQ